MPQIALILPQNPHQGHNLLAIFPNLGRFATLDRCETRAPEFLKVNSALRLSRAAPAPCPFVFALDDWRCQRFVADTGITAIVEGVVNDPMLHRIRPRLLARPSRQGIDFHPPLFVQFKNCQMGARVGLIASATVDPGDRFEFG